ncbi:MAG: hypothetical protein AAFX53_01845 [Bacteroidota bacterium]
MKIRIKGNSIRYRLTKTEVATFCKTGGYSENTKFSSSVFTYELRAKAGIPHPDAQFTNNSIILFLPLEQCKDWDKTPTVGFQYILAQGTGQELSLLVEKDFTCLDRTSEDQSDNYPNPLATPRHQ